MVYTGCAVNPIPCSGKGVAKLYWFFSFAVSVMASVVGYYICKWLDRNN